MHWLLIVFRLTTSAVMCRQSKALSNTTSLCRCYMCVLPRCAAILMVYISASSSTWDFHKSTPFSNARQIYRRPTLHPKRSWFKRLKRLSASAFCSWLKWKHDSLSMMLMFLWPCLANTVCANHVVFSTLGRKVWMVLHGKCCELKVSLCCVFSRRKRTQTEGSRVCAVGTSAPASVSMAGGMNRRALKHCEHCLLP